MKTRIILLLSDVSIITASFLVCSAWYGLGGVNSYILYALLLSIKVILFARYGLYHAILRFAGLPLATTIVKVSTIASLLSALIIYFPIPKETPYGFFATDYLITTFLVGLLRFAPRYVLESWKSRGTNRVLIYGAGDLGEEVARRLLRRPEEYKLVGFIDDKESKIGKRLHNLPVLGDISKIDRILAKERISEVIIAISSLSGEQVRNITRKCRRNGVFCRIVPGLSEMLKQDINIKNIDISDLLKRDPKDLDEPRIVQFIKGKRILITGAGGSIGAELARQCLRYGAKHLALVDHSEFNLYSLREEIGGDDTQTSFHLLNILNKDRLATVFANERPEIVFHAAAYKHVPIVEENPFEGIENNVYGTINAAQISERYKVEKFILISTDKAVRPTSIMGSSKRAAELYIQNLNSQSNTEFIAVRFGNVLGSSGSVIPKFLEQINKGGPVTITHPDVTRYFMLISEAVQLVLQAASIGNGGEIFILNMGKPVRIIEMAEDLIFLSGRQPHKDIKIDITGLRPGEKLYEELLLAESEKKTQYENITIARPMYMDWSYLNENIEQLKQTVLRQSWDDLIKVVKVLVPEYMPDSEHYETHQNLIQFPQA